MRAWTLPKSKSTPVGYNLLLGSNDPNIAIGYKALTASTGNDCTAVGASALVWEKPTVQGEIRKLLVEEEKAADD